MRRREFITLLGGAAAAWPLAARAQQPAIPVIGYLYTGTPEGSTSSVAAFRQGLSEAGFVEGRNVAVEYRWGLSDVRRMPELAADLVARRVAAIAATGGEPASLASKAATSTIPIVFAGGGDPVRAGLVASLNRPGGNVTGITSMSVELGPKRLEILHELVPKAEIFAVFVNSSSPNAQFFIDEAKAAAATVGVRIEALTVTNNRDIDAAFSRISEKRIEALVVSASTYFSNRRVQFATLATRYTVPTIYAVREFAEVGGLMSYGASVKDQYRQAGAYIARILKGEKPADLPVMRATKFELVINQQTARALALDIPPILLARADEVIE